MKTLPITIAVFNGIGDNGVQTTQTDWYRWSSSFVDHFTENGPLTDVEKSQAPAAVFGDWKPLSDPTVDLCTKGSVKGQVRRAKANFLTTHVLALDLEQRPGHGEVHYDEIREALSGFEHVGYTTFSHLCPGKGERYRILLPLKSPMPNDIKERLCRKVRNSSPEQFIGALPELFPWSDHGVSFKWLQIAFLPSCDQTMVDHFQIWQQHGELFDWTDLPLLPEAPKYERDEEPFEDDPNGTPDIGTLNLYRWFDDFDLIIAGEDGDRTIAVDCPNRGNHTNQSGGGSALILEQDGSYGFNCFHSSCNDKNGQNLKLFIREIDKSWADYCRRRPRRTTPMAQTIVAYDKSNTFTAFGSEVSVIDVYNDLPDGYANRIQTGNNEFVYRDRDALIHVSMTNDHRTIYRCQAKPLSIKDQIALQRQHQTFEQNWADRLAKLKEQK